MRWLRALTVPLLLASAPLGAAEPQLRVTTDSTAYCRELAARFAAQATTATEAARGLAEEGAALCATGHSRTGIAKLRRALRATLAGG